MHTHDTIVALASGQGLAAISLIRLSGEEAIAITNKVFKGKNLLEQASHTIHFGTIRDGAKIIDEVLVAVFKAPHSFTTENAVEISCHGSPVIVRELIKVLLKNGARLAEPGEFTKRAFLNGKIDLVQAEAVGDLIHAETDTARQVALQQMRGGYSKDLAALREELIHFASLVELELDFGEEDVEFAKRDDLRNLVVKIQHYIAPLIASFDQGNVIKNGIPTVIAGKPNSGKSTLLNALLNEERAIVSDIPGTTRDFIEDEIVLGGIAFRFVDTAGLRDTTDIVESMGIERTLERMKKASLILYLYDLANTSVEEIEAQEALLTGLSGATIIRVGNKVDKAKSELLAFVKSKQFVLISAAQQQSLDVLKEKILEKVSRREVKQGDAIITSLRHYQQLTQTHEALERVLEGLMTELSGDLIAMDIRQALHYLGELTGAITTDDLLDNIFSKFCIGK